MRHLPTALAALLAIALPALALQPVDRDGLAPRPGADPVPAAAAAPDRVRLREEAQARFREERETRRKAFLTAAEKMAAPAASVVPGWREAAVRPGAAEAAEAEANAGSPLRLGVPLLIFAGVAGALVLLLGAASRLRERGRRRNRAGAARPKRLPPGAMTVKLRPRENRFADAARRT